MVQPATSTSYYSYIVDPILSSSPCQAISALIEKITSIVKAIFTMIINCAPCALFCGSPPAAPAAGAPVDPLVLEFNRAVADDTALLRNQLNRYNARLGADFIREKMGQDERSAQLFLARLLVFHRLANPRDDHLFDIPGTNRTSPMLQVRSDDGTPFSAILDLAPRKSRAAYEGDRYLADNPLEFLADNPYRDRRIDPIYGQAQHFVLHFSEPNFVRKMVAQNAIFRAAANAVRAQYIQA